MELKLSENIRTLRKARGLTQEQLAEALSVSVGVISKWELGLSRPDLRLILKLAEHFEVSIDALLGFQLQNHQRAQIVESLKTMIHNRALPLDKTVVEKHLLKYPNDFDIVYRAATLFSLRGSSSGNKELMWRALELLQHSCGLLSQNTNEGISYTSIQTEIAGLYLSLGRYQEALELFKANNPCGVNDAAIGSILASHLEQPQEAVKHLSWAMLQTMNQQITLALGYLNAYHRLGRYRQMLEVADWALGAINGYRLSEEICSTDKFAASFLAIRAFASLLLGQETEAKAALSQARCLALRFDAAPDYQADRIRFVEVEAATSYDDLGETAMEALQSYMEEEAHQGLLVLWKEVCRDAEA